ncbi:MAG: hypothetical protein KGL39_38755 [Patescibacteria group bacterium]|nr:hypothetical protein [Patescibacteria group bacterium]
MNANRTYEQGLADAYEQAAALAHDCMPRCYPCECEPCRRFRRFVEELGKLSDEHEVTT